MWPLSWVRTLTFRSLQKMPVWYYMQFRFCTPDSATEACLFVFAPESLKNVLLVPSLIGELNKTLDTCLFSTFSFELLKILTLKTCGKPRRLEATVPLFHRPFPVPLLWLLHVLFSVKCNAGRASGITPHMLEPHSASPMLSLWAEA